LSNTTNLAITLNYTSAAKNLPYTTFANNSNSYGNYIVANYLTCLGYKGAAESGTNKYPPVVNISSKIINANIINYTLTIGKNVSISNLHYTVIVFDKYQI
jgi:hypothetical protein